MAVRKLDTILLIDDDKINNYINERILRRMDIADRIEVATNGKIGLDFIKSNCTHPNIFCPDMIILDHSMPVMDGIEFMQALSKLKFEKPKEIVILLLGASLRSTQIEPYLKMGIKEYTTKPLNEEEVWKVYHKYWGHKGMQIG